MEQIRFKNAAEFVDALAQSITKACIDFGVIGVNGVEPTVATTTVTGKHSGADLETPGGIVAEAQAIQSRRKRQAANVAPHPSQPQAHVQAEVMRRTGGYPVGQHEIAFTGKDRPRIPADIFKGFSSIVVYANGQPFELHVNAEGRGRFSWPLLDALDAPRNSVICLESTATAGVFTASVKGGLAKEAGERIDAGLNRAMLEFMPGGPAPSGKRERTPAQKENDKRLGEMARKRRQAAQQTPVAQAQVLTALTAAPRRRTERKPSGISQARHEAQQQVQALTRNRSQRSGSVEGNLLRSVGVNAPGGQYTVPQY